MMSVARTWSRTGAGVFGMILAFTPVAVAAGDIREGTIPPRSYAEFIRQHGPFPSCEAAEPKHPSQALKSCAWDTGDTHSVEFFKVVDAAGRTHVGQLVYIGEVFAYKTHAVGLGMLNRAEGLQAFNAHVETISTEIGVQPVVLRNWSSVAVDRADHYIDFNHFLNVAREVRRWEEAREPITSLDWNSVVTVWKAGDDLFVSAAFNRDELIGTQITVIVENSALCVKSVGGMCQISQDLREFAAGRSLHARQPAQTAAPVRDSSAGSR